MRYMLLIYQKEDAGAPPSQYTEKAVAGHWAVMDETKKLGIFRGAEPLHPTSTATTIRMQEGKIITVDGPFAETKEQLAGYYILDCKDQEEAISWASKLPLTCSGGQGCIEVRPLRELPVREQQSENARYATLNA
jgi:hypothetical protein